MCICSVPCEDDEERRGSLTTARRGSRLSDIIQMQVMLTTMTITMMAIIKMMTMTMTMSDNVDDDENEDYVLQERRKAKKGRYRDKQGFTWRPFTPQVGLPTNIGHKFGCGQISAKTRRVKWCLVFI